MKKAKCIIVIEEEPYLQQNLVKFLIHHDFDVFAYSQAEHAIESEILNLADAIILDINLPGITGWQATSIIKKNNADLPVLVLFRISDINIHLQGLIQEADDFIIMPFQMTELI